MWWPSFVAVLRDLWLFAVRWPALPLVVTEVAQLPTQPVMRPLQTSSEVAKNTTTHTLHTGQVYDATNEVVQAIRSYLRDYDAHLVRSGVLTPKEWLLYTLLKQKASVPVLALHMTPLGSWHTTLRGLTGVTVGIQPRTRALIEWVESATSSQVGLVLSVTPAEEIVVGQLSESGLYTQTTYDRASWLELRPVFTTV